MQLRPYQQDCVDQTLENLLSGKNALIWIPTGGGKTEIFFEICRRFVESRPDATVAIILNRVLLLDQTVKRIEKIFKDVGIVCGSLNKKDYQQITVGTIGSMKDMSFDLVVLDECHRSSEKEDSLYRRFLNNQKTVLGVSATPWRYDGYIYGEGKRWPEVTYKKPLREMLDEGWLVTPIIRKSKEEFDLSGVKTRLGDYEQGELSKRVSDERKVSKQVTDALEKAYDRKSIAWICVNIDHANMVRNELFKRDESSVIIHSEKSNKEVISDKELFSSGFVRHAVSVMMLSEGFDAPRIDCVVMMRPTKSSSLWLQAAGRALRTFPDKKDALILDYGRVIESCGPLDSPVVRSAYKQLLSPAAPPMKFCESCLAYIPAAAMTCPHCDYKFPKPPPDKNLTVKSSDASPLYRPIADTWVEVKPEVSIRFHLGKKKKCFRLQFYPKGFLSDPISDWAFDWNLSQKFSRLGIQGVYNVDQAMKYDNTKYKTNISKILLSYDGQYPTIKEMK